MAPAQASPFVCISTNQFKSQPLLAHLTGELTLVVKLQLDIVGVNFQSFIIESFSILRLDYNAQEFSRDL